VLSPSLAGASKAAIYLPSEEISEAMHPEQTGKIIENMSINTTSFFFIFKALWFSGSFDQFYDWLQVFRSDIFKTFPYRTLLSPGPALTLTTLIFLADVV